MFPYYDVSLRQVKTTAARAKISFSSRFQLHYKLIIELIYSRFIETDIHDITVVPWTVMSYGSGHRLCLFLLITYLSTAQISRKRSVWHRHKEAVCLYSCCQINPVMFSFCVKSLEDSPDAFHKQLVHTSTTNNISLEFTQIM